MALPSERHNAQLETIGAFSLKYNATINPTRLRPHTIQMELSILE